MTNHPNRNWRRRMQQAADQWLSQFPWRTEPGARMMSESDLREAMRRAYVAGFEDGRKKDD